MAVFGLQQKHAFGILMVNIKESSALPVVYRYSDPNASNYGNAQLLYQDLVAHYTQGLTGRQCLEIVEREIDDLHLDQKWGKTCESFLNLVNNKLKDHMGIAPDPAQYPDSWYITQLNHTMESHTMLHQYIINHQMQADSITQHLGTLSATTITYESYLETVRTFCQMIDHANRKAVQEKTHRKVLQTEFEQSGGHGCRGPSNIQGGCTDGYGHTQGHG